MSGRSWLLAAVLAGVDEGDSFFATKVGACTVLERSGVTAISDFLLLCFFTSTTGDEGAALEEGVSLVPSLEEPEEVELAVAVLASRGKLMPITQKQII